MRAAVLRCIANTVTSCTGRITSAIAFPMSKTIVDFSKVGSSARHFMPALHHEGIHSRRTVFWAGQKLSRSDHLNDFLITVAIIRLKTITVNLP